MLELLAGVLSGGATGLLGTALTGVFSFLGKKQAHKQELELRQLDIELTRFEAESAERVSALELESDKAQAEADALKASYRQSVIRFTEGYDLSGAQVWALLFLDCVRGLMRPALTLAFVAITGVIYFTIDGYTGIASIDEAADDIRLQIIMTVLFLTTTCVTWWFGGRSLKGLSTKSGGG